MKMLVGMGMNVRMVRIGLDTEMRVNVECMIKLVSGL